MDKAHFGVLRNELFSRVRSIVYEKYGEFIPASMMESEAQSDDVVRITQRIGSFKSDQDLLDVLDALRKLFEGNYGYCLFCRKEIEFNKLRDNPLAKFCDDCERILSPTFSGSSVELEKRMILR